MRKNLVFALIALSLLLIAIWLYLSQNQGSFKRELKDFAVEDTALVTKVFMVDKASKSVTLERKPEGWMVNGRFEARKDGMETLLKTLLRMEVKAPVPKTAFETVVRNMATQSVKVEVYLGDDEPGKVFYVGGATPDNLGTYMLMENSSVPFIMYIPGFSGFLTTRFYVEENQWINPILFQYSYEDIASVTLEVLDQPQESFRISSSGRGKVKLESLWNGASLSGFDSLAAREYMGLFKKLSYETILTGLSKGARDSIFRSKPVNRITVVDRQNSRKTLSTYLRPPTGIVDDAGKPFMFDVERVNAIISGDTNIYVVQLFLLDPIMVGIDFFKAPPGKEAGAISGKRGHP